MTPPVPVRIVRGAGARRIDAWHVHGLDALWLAMGVGAPQRQCLCADLSLGAWRGHWLAREWGSQLGLDEPDDIQPALYAGGGAADSYADTVGTLIDNESEGDRNFISAHALACRLAAAARAQAITHLLVAAPLAHHPWGSENLQLIKLLHDAGPQCAFRLAVLLRADAAVPQVPGIELLVRNSAAPLVARGPAFPVPGLADAALAAGTDGAADALPLRDGRLFISPNRRDPHGRATVAAPLEAHLQVYFALRDGCQDVDFLQRQAALRFAEGAYGLAFAILDQIDQQRLDPLPAALVEAQKQNIAIALMDFRRAAQGRLPADALPPVVKASLYQSKAWGMVMSGQAAEAEAYFALARRYLDARQHQRLYLYLLNISALNQLRLGCTEQALAFESEIEAALLQLPAPDWHLVYINSLNQARIHKKCRAFEQAEHYYHRAFVINHQLRNESDLLYANLCYAQLESLRGAPAKALIYWVRTCLHWLSNPLPEALAPRVAQAILGMPLSNQEADVEQISGVLGAQLQAAAGALGRAFAPFAHPLAFARIEAGSGAALCLAQPGWSVFGSPGSARLQPVFAGPAYHLLNRQVVGVLAAHFPQVDFSQFRALFTDAQCGIELADNPRELVWSCVKWGVPELLREERRYPIDGASMQALAGFGIQSSRAISAVHAGGQECRVQFKRYRRALALNDAERRCLQHLRQPSTIGDTGSALGMDLHSCVHLINGMAEKRLVSLL